MAENASAQSAHVSSSHGAEGGAKSGACCDSSVLSFLRHLADAGLNTTTIRGYVAPIFIRSPDERSLFQIRLQQPYRELHFTLHSIQLDRATMLPLLQELVLMRIATNVASFMAATVLWSVKWNRSKLGETLLLTAAVGQKKGIIKVNGEKRLMMAPSLPEKGIESTEKVDVFQAAEVDYYMKAAPGVTPNASDLLFSRPKSPYSALVSGESGELNQSKWEDAYKEGEKPTVYGDQKEKWNMTVTAPAGLKILMLSEHEQYIKTSEADGLFQSSSQASVSEKTCSDLESPSSPFEVLVGKTEFSNSSADSSGHEGQAGTFVEKGWLMNSWSSEPYESSGARTAGDIPVGPPSYESVTRQATAVNSLDFQGLTSHILSDCDMTSKVFLAGDVGQLNDPSTDFQRVGLFDLSPEVMPKITPYQRGHDHFHSQLGKQEDAVVYSQAKAIGMQKEALQLGKNIEKEILAEADTVTGYKTHLSEDSLFSPHLLNSFQATADSNWPDNAEMAEADSSGESDDTVIEDTKAGLTLIGKKAEKLESPEAVEASKSGSEQILGEKKLAGPFTLVLVPGQVKESESSPEELAYHEKSRLPYAIPEEDSEFMDDFETLQNPATAGFDESEFSEQATSIKELSKSGVRKLEMPYTLSEFSRASPAEVMREVEQSVQDKESFFLSFDMTTGASDEHHDSIHGESFIDFRKERNAKNSKDLLETSAQVNEANVDAGKMHESATDLHVGRILMLKKLPLAETGTEGHGTFAQPGELANKYTLHGGTVSGVKLQPSPASPEDSPEAAAFFLDLNQEQLTITALRELSTIPDESPVSAEESCSPSPKESSTFITADQLEETFAPYCETMSKVLLIKEEVNMLPAFPSTQFVHESQSQEGSSGTKELTKERGFARLLTSCSVRDLVFWRDVKKSGMVFGTSLVLLLSLAAFSVISVIAYLILALLSVTISFRVYRSVIQAVQKSEEGHPFKPWLDVDISVSSEAFHNHVNTGLVYVNKALKQVIRLFLVQDLVDSLKLAVCMWLMTYVGAVFNGITLLILGLLMAFTVPIVYEKYQTQIDHYISIIREQSKAILAKVHAKLPGLAKKKAE